MAQDTVALRFNEVSFEYQANKKLLDEVEFSIRSGSRITLMGQNGAGKSSIFKLITGEAKPTSGKIFCTPIGSTIALARQVMPDKAKEMFVQEFFQTAF